MLENFNLSEAALKHKSLMYYLIIVLLSAGIFGYFKLGRMEDPDFVIRQMLVSVAWPGATASEMEEQVTDKIERKLQEIPYLDFLQSVSRPGLAMICITLKAERPANEVRPAWVEARNLVADIRGELPGGVLGPFFNDRFDDVFGSIYALTSDGFSYEEMRQTGERIRRRLLAVDSIKRVELIGVQEEKIYVELEKSRLAELGIPPVAVMEAVNRHNAMLPAGMVETSTDNVHVRLSGSFDSLEAIRSLPITQNGRSLRLGDIAVIRRGYAEPAGTLMSYNGQKSIAVAVSMEPGGNILQLGRDMDAVMEEIIRDLPAGLAIERVSSQPQVVAESIADFVSTLREAVIIVLGISFISLGLRTGMVVALCIPTVLAGVFLCMYILGIDLHKVSLGALIVSLGLLVDDEIIAVEMMAVKMESGMPRAEAAGAAYHVTAVPMLTGTLVTCAGFIPIGFSKGMAAEFTAALFPVISIALLLSWIVSVTVAPLFGCHIMQNRPKKERGLYSGRFYSGFRKTLAWCLRRRGAVLFVTALVFGGSVFALQFVKKDFFPASVRPEIIVQMTLPAGSSVRATAAEARRFADFLDGESGIKNYTYYVGEGSPRFLLTIEPVLPASNYAQFVIVAGTIAERVRLQKKIAGVLNEHFPQVVGNMRLIQTGPPSAYPVMLRVAGYDKGRVRELAAKLADIMRANPNIYNVNFNWNEMGKSLRLHLDNDKIRALGLDKQTLSAYLQAQLSGLGMAEFYDGDRTIEIVLRMNREDRDYLGRLEQLPVFLPGGRYVQLGQIAAAGVLEAEESVIWRRNLQPAITVQGNIQSGTATEMTRWVYEQAEELRAGLPRGYSIEMDGAAENSAKSLRHMLAPVPWMAVAIITILMLQLQRFSLMFLALCTAPLGLVGVTAGMLVFGQPLGFVAQLGILALSGMIIRNSVILIVQIEKHLAQGESPRQAIIESAVFRFRPIMLTAAAAVCAMIPLTRNVFWGPMAVAVAGGLLAATVLTLLVLPCMYAFMFNIREV
ncbi:MAG: efflux RND transporter permease subunit [Deltaproteobacteria bacterium]|jgi:multidrug efflux pump|nr:efflux RND transporter permease subunit [Deltaproteobacteria bacterium]